MGFNQAQRLALFLLIATGSGLAIPVNFPPEAMIIHNRNFVPSPTQDFLDSPLERRSNVQSDGTGPGTLRSKSDNSYLGSVTHSLSFEGANTQSHHSAEASVHASATVESSTKSSAPSSQPASSSQSADAESDEAEDEQDDEEEEEESEQEACDEVERPGRSRENAHRGVEAETDESEFELEEDEAREEEEDQDGDDEPDDDDNDDVDEE